MEDSEAEDAAEMLRPSCFCEACLYGLHAPDEDGEARAWVLHDASMIETEDHALALLTFLDHLDETEERLAGRS